MKPGKPPSPEEPTEEISALIETLHQTEKRLHELTAGEVDAVTSRSGRTIVLRHAQDQLRHSEAAKQAAILNALPAHIALLDSRGAIVSVNEAWRRSGRNNAVLGPGYEAGVDYLDICDSVRGKGTTDANRAATGIRSVLDGTAKRFSLEYPCHSPTQQRWFLMTVTPMAEDRLRGVVVMHLDITERKRVEEELEYKNAMLQTQQEVSPDAILVVDENAKIVSYNQQFIELWRLSPQLVSAQADAPVLQSVAEQVEDSEAFVARVEYLYLHRDEKSHAEIRLKDGRVIDRHSAPIKDADGRYYGRIWYFRDITERKQAEQALRESERRFSDMLENVGLVSVMLDLEARITYCNEYLLHLTGWRREEVIGKDWFELFVPPELNALKAGVFTPLFAGQPDALHHENEIVTRSGERRLIRWNNSVQRSGAGDAIGMASIGEDITERKAAENRVAYLSRVHAVLSGINALIVRVHDRDELFREACRVAVESGGFNMAMIGIVDRDAMKIVPVASAGKDEALLSAIKSLLSSGELASDTMVARAIRDKKFIVANDSQNDPQVLLGKQYAKAGIGSIIILPLIVSDEAMGALALYAGERNFFHAEELKLLTELADDIAFAIDHLDKQARLNYLAYYDVLTGLANRALFHERLGQGVLSAKEQAHKLALVLMDIERFKAINDTLGRAAGDVLLKDVAARLTKYAVDAVRVGRIDADHFAVMVPEFQTEVELAHLIEQQLGKIFDANFHVGDSNLRIAARFGIALFPADGADADTLFRNAEAALKKAKASNERYLFYNHEMNARVAENLALENQLRQALEQDEFVLYYQPKVNLVSGKMTSVEALIRWNDPRTGLVPPELFIPILEETGLIHEVGRWALRQAIADYLRWHGAGLPAVRIAVNVSPMQLRHHGFIAEIEQAIGIAPHAAAGLELEITESLIMENVQLSISTLQAIRAMGVSIAIDDFGTGFSSLGYLARLPVDTLKIDRSFVIDMTHGADRVALVSSIINMAHALKLKVVAEGVETEEQSRLLRSLDCDEMQGYLFSKPVPGDVFEAKFLAAPTLKDIKSGRR